MKADPIKLMEELKTTTQEFISTAQTFRQLTPKQLNHCNAPGSWSVLECLEHLNLYGDFYLKELEKQILKAPQANADYIFKSGWMGNYFANSMLPKNGKINKMKTFKDKNPIHLALDQTTIDRFLKQQEMMLQLLEQAKRVNLNKVQTGISITNLIRLKLGDTFRFVIYHNLRHMKQAQRVAETALAEKNSKAGNFKFP